MPVQHFALACDSDDEISATPMKVPKATQFFSLSLDSDAEDMGDDIATPRQTSAKHASCFSPSPSQVLAHDLTTPRNTAGPGCQHFFFSPLSANEDDDEADGAITPPPPPLSPPRKGTSMSPYTDAKRKGFGFSLCDDSDGQEATTLSRANPGKIERMPPRTKTSADCQEPLEKDAIAPQSRSALTAPVRNGADEPVGPPKKVQPGRSRTGAARLFGRHIQAIKAEKDVDKAAAVITNPSSSVVEEHVDDVMRNLSYRQRLDVQKHIDTVMRSAAERMGCRTTMQKQELCDRANDAICAALERNQERTRTDSMASYGSDPSQASHQSQYVDPEWELALRAKIRLAVQGAWERRAKENESLEDTIAAARQAAQERRNALQNVEIRILMAAQEACLRRGGHAALVHSSSVGPLRKSTNKPKVDIPEGKLDEYFGRIWAEAKERASLRSVHHGEADLLNEEFSFSKPFLNAASLDDAGLTTYFRKVVSEAKDRAGVPEAAHDAKISDANYTKDVGTWRRRQYGDLFQ